MPREKERQRQKTDPDPSRNETPLEDQQSIDDILDKSKKIIEKNRENTQKQEKRKQ